MAGLLQKAAAGAAAGTEPALRGGIVDYLDQMRDERQARRQERLQSFQRSEREATQTFQAGQAGEERAFRGAQNTDQMAVQLYLGGLADERSKESLKNDKTRADAYQALARVQTAVANVDLETKKKVQDIQKQYLEAKTPQEREQLADSLYTVLGKDKFTPVTGRDDLGNPQFVGAFNTRSGQLMQPGRAQAPKAGDVVDGFKFKGGNLNDRSNWEPVSQTQPGQPAKQQPMSQPIQQQTTAGRSQEEVDVMIENAGRGYQPAIDYLNDAIQKNVLSVGQRLRAREALNSRR